MFVLQKEREQTNSINKMTRKKKAAEQFTIRTQAISQSLCPLPTRKRKGWGEHIYIYNKIEEEGFTM